MFHGIEELTDVQIQHPVHLSRHNRRVQSIQRVMLTSSRSESIGKSQKVSIVDLVQHRHHRLLYDLVLQTYNSQRSFYPVFFEDKHLPCRLGSVLSPLKSVVECSEIVMRVSFITVPCHSVTAGCRLTFELMETLLQQRFVYVVEKTGNLLMFIPSRSFPHSPQT